MSKWRSVTSGVPHGLVLGLVLFNIFVGNTGSGIERTISTFADNAKLRGAVNTLEGRDAIQRDLDRLERWARANCMKFNKAKCKVLHVGQDNVWYQYRLGGEWIEGSPEEKDLEGVGGQEAQHEPAVCACSPESQPCPGLRVQQHDQQVEGILSLYSALMRPPCSAASSSGVPSTRRTWSCWSESRGGHGDDARAGAPLL
ncbi:mitochondrial enolase superfamily member 1 [Grus japonensis]|uniref:Mitochondrial enolase superfamily member 1 n=1 Tax=Grus japonensis TaxID=30415 RepID=A0ABC9XXL1_GRUJA